MSAPLSDPVLHILLAVSDRPRHGYGIVQEIEERTGGAVRLGTGTLYTALKRLRGEGLIEETADPDEVDTGERRRRTYRLTRRGETELAEQVQRLSALVAHARQKRALPVPGHAS